MAKRSRETIEQKIVIGFFRGIWWLLKLPFRGLRKKEKFSLEDRKFLISKKREIEELLASRDHLRLRQAVLESDKLVDWVLKKDNYRGETFADRLRSAEKNIPPEVYNSIWQAHKIRNQLVHETKAEISKETLHQAVKKYFHYLSRI